MRTSAWSPFSYAVMTAAIDLGLIGADFSAAEDNPSPVPIVAAAEVANQSRRVIRKGRFIHSSNCSGEPSGNRYQASRRALALGQWSATRRTVRGLTPT